MLTELRCSGTDQKKKDLWGIGIARNRTGRHTEDTFFQSIMQQLKVHSEFPLRYPCLTERHPEPSRCSLSGKFSRMDKYWLHWSSKQESLCGMGAPTIKVSQNLFDCSDKIKTGLLSGALWQEVHQTLVLFFLHDTYIGPNLSSHAPKLAKLFSTITFRAGRLQISILCEVRKALPEATHYTQVW